jgi:hypothetical protein
MDRDIELVLTLVAFEADDPGGLVPAVALGARDFSHMGVVGIGLHILGQSPHGRIVPVANHAGLRGHGLLGGLFFLVAVETDDMDTGLEMVTRDKSLLGCLGPGRERHGQQAKEECKAAFGLLHGRAPSVAPPLEGEEGQSIALVTRSNVGQEVPTSDGPPRLISRRGAVMILNTYKHTTGTNPHLERISTKSRNS